MLNNRFIHTEDHSSLRDLARRFLSEEVQPNFDRWEEAGMIDRVLWNKCGDAGLLCPQVPVEFGGIGGDYLLNSVITEEFAYSGYSGPAVNIPVHNDICCGYLLSYGTQAQKEQWLPRMVSGEVVTAIAMTEPGSGSDLRGIRTRAERVGDEFIVSGQKTFISNGQHCDLVIVLAKTGDPATSRSMNLILVETSAEGFRRGRRLHKLGQLSADTVELYFDDLRVPARNLLGPEDVAMSLVMKELPQERLMIAISSIAAAQKAYDLARDYVRERRAFGKAVVELQNTRFKLADMKAELAVGWAYIDQCLVSHLGKTLTATDASIAKLWASEMQGRVVDQALQFFGGYGFMREYEICRLYADARVHRIYGGTSEIMRELISRDL